MLEFEVVFAGALIILSILIFIFIYSAISVEMLTSIICFLIFLILLIPFYIVVEKLKVIIYQNNIENLPFFKFFNFYSNLIICFILIYLAIESAYLIAFS